MANLSLATKLPGNGYCSNSDLLSCLLTIHLAMIQLSTCLAMLTSDWDSNLNSNSERLRMRPKCPTPFHREFSGECVVLSEY